MAVGALTDRLDAEHAMLGMETNERHATDAHGAPFCGTDDELFSVPEDDVTCAPCVRVALDLTPTDDEETS